MNYTLWEDSEGNVHEISKMSTKYIKSCIKCIENTNYKIYTKESAKKDKTHNIFGPWWCYENAQNFLNAFESELSIRKRGKKRIIHLLHWISHVKIAINLPVRKMSYVMIGW